MNIRPNKNLRRNDYRYLSEVKDYHGLSHQERDIAINGVPYRGQRYPLCYIFWGTERHREVYIILTGESGTQLGESIIEHSQNFETSTRAIVQVGERITDLSYSVLRFK